VAERVASQIPATPMMEVHLSGSPLENSRIVADCQPPPKTFSKSYAPPEERKGQQQLLASQGNIFASHHDPGTSRVPD